MKEKLLTVSIAAYNVEKYIREALEPFIDDDILDKVEVLIIDDGGSDGTLHIAGEYEKKYPGTFITVHKTNGGWGSTVNYGIEHATGKFFKQLDGDDYYDRKGLNSLINILENSTSDIVYTNYDTFDDSTHELLSRFVFDNRFSTDIIYDLERLEYPLDIAMHSSCFNTGFLKRNNIRLTEHCFYTDVEFVIKAYIHASSIMFLNKTVYKYRMSRSGQSVSMEGYTRHHEEHLKVIENILQCYSVAHLMGSKRNIIKNCIQKSVENEYNILLFMNPCKENKNRLISFDDMLKQKYMDFYDTDVKLIRIARLLNFSFYSPIVKARIRKMKMNRG